MDNSKTPFFRGKNGPFETVAAEFPNNGGVTSTKNKFRKIKKLLH